MWVLGVGMSRSRHAGIRRPVLGSMSSLWAMLNGEGISAGRIVIVLEGGGEVLEAAPEGQVLALGHALRREPLEERHVVAPGPPVVEGAAAAEAVLEIVAPLVGVFHDGHQDRVELRVEPVARGDPDLALVRFRPGLVEAVVQVLAVEHDEVHDGLEVDPNRWPFLTIQDLPLLTRIVSSWISPMPHSPPCGLQEVLRVDTWPVADARHLLAELRLAHGGAAGGVDQHSRPHARVGRLLVPRGGSSAGSREARRW